jgi:hypothetical protein
MDDLIGILANLIGLFHYFICVNHEATTKAHVEIQRNLPTPSLHPVLLLYAC